MVVAAWRVHSMVSHSMRLSVRLHSSVPVHPRCHSQSPMASVARPWSCDRRSTSIVRWVVEEPVRRVVARVEFECDTRDGAIGWIERVSYTHDAHTGRSAGGMEGRMAEWRRRRERVESSLHVQSRNARTQSRCTTIDTQRTTSPNAVYA
jgi:hypothetical protein